MKIRIVVFAAISLMACTAKAPREYTQITGFAQGTTYTITYFDPQMRSFSEPIEALLERVDSSMSVYRPNSIINAFNRSEAGCVVDTLLARVVAISAEISRETDGAFDITVGPLVKAWGFYAKQGATPSESEIATLMQLTGAEMVSLEGLFLTKNKPNVVIDVNAVAQGYTVDLIAELLEGYGVEHYLVELGGEIRTLGQNPKGRSWAVGIDKPVDNALSGEEIQAIITVSGQSMVTSGNYRKFFVKDGVKYSHTINPSTGKPVTHSLLSATVIDKTAARADALATAFMVMGVDSTRGWLTNHPGVEAYLVYSNTNGDYNVWMSDGITKRLVKQ